MSEVSQEERFAIEEGRQARAAWQYHYEKYYTEARLKLLHAFEQCKQSQRDDMVDINMQLRALNQLKADLDKRMAIGTAVEAQVEKRRGH